MSDEEETEIQSELVMPFVTVTSKGGPHEDEAYVAGWEMGQLDTILELVKPEIRHQPVKTANLAQADLIAMRHNYTLKTDGVYAVEWTQITLVKVNDEQATTEKS